MGSGLLVGQQLVGLGLQLVVHTCNAPAVVGWILLNLKFGWQQPMYSVNLTCTSLAHCTLYIWVQSLQLKLLQLFLPTIHFGLNVCSSVCMSHVKGLSQRRFIQQIVRNSEQLSMCWSEKPKLAGAASLYLLVIMLCVCTSSENLMHYILRVQSACNLVHTMYCVSRKHVLIRGAKAS